MATMDIFNNRAFDLVSMTSMVNKVPFQPNRLQSLNLAVPRGIRTVALSIEKKEGKLNLIQTSERGAPLDQGSAVKRDIRDFRTNRIAKSDTIYADEIQGIRADGTESELKQVQVEIAERAAQIEVDFNLTEEHMWLGAIQGIVLDADGSVINNWFDEWGINAAAPVSWNLATGSLANFRVKANELKRRMHRNAKGLAWGGKIHALCGDEFYDKLTTHTEIEKTYLNQAEARELRADKEGKVFDAFSFAGIEWENYRGTDDLTTIALPSDGVRFFPSGGSGIFFDVRAPGESFKTVNTKGKRRYSMLIKDRDRDTWVKPEMYSYPLIGCVRPEMLEGGLI